jgi:hypothetical protein
MVASLQVVLRPHCSFHVRATLSVHETAREQELRILFECMWCGSPDTLKSCWQEHYGHLQGDHIMIGTHIKGKHSTNMVNT